MKIGGRRYVDGGVCSVSNLDLVAGRGLDLVICLNPLTSSSEARDSRGGITGVATGAINDVLDLIPSHHPPRLARRLEREERKVRRFGTEVVIIEPTAEDHAVMGRNWMSAERRQHVIETAEETVAKQLKRPCDAGSCSSDLPAGEPHKISRPSGPPSTWPELRAPVRRAA